MPRELLSIVLDVVAETIPSKVGLLADLLEAEGRRDTQRSAERLLTAVRAKSPARGFDLEGALHGLGIWRPTL